MKLHGNARTCPKSRRLLVDRLEGEWSLTEAAEAAGVSERTAASGSPAGAPKGRRAYGTEALRPIRCQAALPRPGSRRSLLCAACG